MYLFSWDNVPGKDNGRLVEYLEQKYGVDWARTAKIEKIDNNEIKVATEKNFLSLRLNNEQTKVTLTINNVRTDEFIVKIENSKLNIYKDIEQEKQAIRQGVKVKEISYPYSVLGGLVIAGLIVVALMGYYGTQSAGVFTPREAFFVIGASILILSAAAVYMFLTMRNTISVLKIHEEELQSARDMAQEGRIASLEGTRAGATASLGPRVTALEPQLASLETRVTALERERATSLSSKPAPESARVDEPQVVAEGGTERRQGGRPRPA